MTNGTSVELIPISYWAVGRLPDAEQIAIRLNDFAPILMSVEVAREIAGALSSEIATISKPRSGRVAARSKQSRQK